MCLLFVFLLRFNCRLHNAVNNKDQTLITMIHTFLYRHKVVTLEAVAHFVLHSFCRVVNSVSLVFVYSEFFFLDIWCQCLSCWVVYSSYFTNVQTYKVDFFVLLLLSSSLLSALLPSYVLKSKCCHVYCTTIANENLCLLVYVCANKYYLSSRNTVKESKCGKAAGGLVIDALYSYDCKGWHYSSRLAVVIWTFKTKEVVLILGTEV